MKRKNKDIIYLDNNATTHMSNSTKKILERYEDAENISSFTPSAKQLKTLIERKTKSVLKRILPIEKFLIIFTSGATESNDTALRMVHDTFLKKKRSSPFTILTSDVEHHSFLEAMENLPKSKMIKIKQEKDGRVDPKKFIEKISSNNINFVTCMSANNETGAINNIKRLSSYFKKSGIHFHCDATQTFGKLKSIDYSNCASISMSFHKTHGPKGIGLLLINKSIYKKEGLSPLFPGTQNDGLRGGTENPGLILAGLNGLNETIDSYIIKNGNRSMNNLQNDFFEKWENQMKVPVHFYKDYIKMKNGNVKNKGGMILRLSPPEPSDRLPSTLLISFFHAGRYQEGKKICNIKIRKCLYDESSIIISIGSTCLTNVKGASHVITSLINDPAIRCGVVRISLSPETTKEDMNTLFSTLVSCLEKQRFFSP